MDSLACLRPLGMMVSFGNASGPVPAFEPALLAKMGSLFLTRPTLFHYTARRADLLAMADELFAVVAAGQVRISVNQRYPSRMPRWPTRRSRRGVPPAPPY
jgi:NADPH2:quinone reductase